MSSVDDPEKHFLGNLLEDDPLSSGGPSSSAASLTSRSNETSTTTSQQSSDNNNIISAFRPIGLSSSIWPEPPPPYSPPAEPWLTVGGPPQTTTTNGQFSGDWFSSQYDRKELSPINNNNATSSSSSAADSLFAFIGNTTTNGTTAPASIVPQSPPHVHHFHHNLHHHTHTHNVVQNHYFTATPTGIESLLSTTTSTTAPPPAVPALAPENSTHGLFADSSALASTWSYAGINENAATSSLSFSDWKKEVLKVSSTPAQVVEDQQQQHQQSKPAKKGKQQQQQTMKTYADASNSLAAAAAKTPAPPAAAAVTSGSTSASAVAIGSEKKQKQDLAKKLSNQAPITRIVVNGQPHSAPVLTKMPFSYRDVAARDGNHGQTDGSPPHTVRKNSIVSDSKEDVRGSVKPKLNQTTAEKTKNGGITRLTVANGDAGKRRTEAEDDATTESNQKRQMTTRERKSRADNEFQKITKKTIGGKEVTQPLIMLDGMTPMEASTRYEVLNNLEKQKNQRNGGKKNGNDRAPVIEQVFSRSSSPGTDEVLEDTENEAPRVRSLSRHNNSSGNHHSANQNSRKEQKKRAALQQQAANQKRRQKRKAEPHWTDNVFWTIAEFLMLIGSYISSGFQWTVQLFVDVCLKIYDVFMLSTEAVYYGTLNGIKRMIVYVFMAIVYVALSFWMFIRSITLTRLIEQLLYEDRPEILEWGCRRDLSIPSSAAEYIDRLVKETSHDAYVVLGLRCDCSDDDIKRYFKKICALVSPDKCQLDGAEEAFDLVNRAFDAIGNQENRANYTMANAYENEEHKYVINAWDDLRERIEETRCTIYCDCGSRHMRLATTIRPSEARYCRRCDMMHPAKQNDIWVEKRYLGLKSVYLTCADNMVYDISEWAVCESQRTMLKNMRAHTHNVQYRLVTPTTNPDLEYSTSATTSSSGGSGSMGNGTNSQQMIGSSGGNGGICACGASTGGAGGSMMVGGGGSGGHQTHHHHHHHHHSHHHQTAQQQQQQQQHDVRFFGDFHEEITLLRQQRSLAQISFKTCEPREEDRSRRAANRRQKRWRN